jgi:hypothetical protein
MALNTLQLLCGGISCDHMASPKGLSSGTQKKYYMQHTGSKLQSAIGIKDISP